MSLLQNLPYKEYQKITSYTIEQCERVAKVADLRNLSFEGKKKPGEILIKTLDRCGYSVEQVYNFLIDALTIKKHIYYRPRAKIAILIGNDQYSRLPKLVSPPIDCENLTKVLKGLGFTVITLKNTVSRLLKTIFNQIIKIMPADSYFFIYYAGHGCELCNIKCMLGIDCPTENIQSEHLVTENFVLNQVATAKPELSILLMDMCRVSLDRSSNPQIFAQIPDTEAYTYTIHKNLLIGYSTVSSQSAYEMLQIECSKSIDNDETYELKTGDKFIQGTSQYANALCSHLSEDLDASTMIDKVHEDVENSPKKQKPVKIQCGTAKRSLCDPISGDSVDITEKLQQIGNGLNDSITALIS